MGNIKPNDTMHYVVMAAGGLHGADWASQHFAAPPSTEPDTILIDIDRDGKQEEMTLRPAEMPYNLTDPGYDTEMSPMESFYDWNLDPEFQECLEFARANGLTAAVVQPTMNDPDLLVYIESNPVVIYLDADGNQVEPQGAPNLSSDNDLDTGTAYSPENEGGEYFTEIGPDGEERRYFTQDNGFEIHTYFVWTSPDGEEMYINPSHQDNLEAIIGSMTPGSVTSVPLDFFAPNIEIPLLREASQEQENENEFNGDRFDAHFAAGREFPDRELCDGFCKAATPNAVQHQQENTYTSSPTIGLGGPN